MTDEPDPAEPDVPEPSDAVEPDSDGDAEPDVPDPSLFVVPECECDPSEPVVLPHPVATCAPPPNCTSLPAFTPWSEWVCEPSDEVEKLCWWFGVECECDATASEPAACEWFGVECVWSGSVEWVSAPPAVPSVFALESRLASEPPMSSSPTTVRPRKSGTLNVVAPSPVP